MNNGEWKVNSLSANKGDLHFTLSIVTIQSPHKQGFIGEMTREGTGNREQEVLLPRFLLKPLGFQGGSDYSCSLFPAA